jgi:5-hydroxyisourate hydrolase-like protein (transthyretin family)
MRMAGAGRLLAILFLLLSAPVAVHAQGTERSGVQGPGVIEGQVVNASSGQVPEAGLPVNLWALDAQQQSIMQNGVTDADGRFRFEGLDVQAYSYQVQAQYRGIDHWSAVLAFSEGQNLLSVLVPVYDTTTSEADLSVERAHLIVDFWNGNLEVQELQILVNEGTQTYVGSGEGRETLRFPLPPGATGLQMSDELVACCIVGTAEGFAYTQPVLPGASEFFFSYELAYQSATYTLAKNLAYPVQHLDVLVADNGLKVTVPGLVAQEPILLQDRSYLHLTGEALSAGQTLALHFASLPLPAQARESGGSTSPLLVRAVIGLGTLATILALAYPFFSKRAGEAS